MEEKIRGEAMLRLRPYKNCDAEYIVSWIKNEISLYQWSADQFGKYPITAEDIRQYYAGYADSDHLFAMIAFDESGAVGHLLMRFLDEEKSILRFGFIIVDDSRRGKGYGREMLSLALKYAFEILKVKKVTLGVFENNPAAYRCYSSLGFREETPRKTTCYPILGETWECLEMEFTNET